MRRLMLTMLMLGVLAACQSQFSRENDPPVVDESDCQQRQLDAGTCGAQ
jgi:hypothetical protein